MSAGTVRLEKNGAVATITFERPDARNAMTWTMYEEFSDIVTSLREPGDIRVVVLRGAGRDAFVAGTDIARFHNFAGAQDGIEYEREMDEYLEVLLRVPVPTIARLEGWTVGGGLNIAASCDIRIATPRAKFGTPIARTLGNCMSMRNYARLLAAFGEGPAKRMLLLAEMIDAQTALDCGFLSRIVEPDDMDGEIARCCAQIQELAPLTLRASKEALRRITGETSVDGDDLIAMCYGSRDFQTGVAAFTSKRKPNWEGR